MRVRPPVHAYAAAAPWRPPDRDRRLRAPAGAGAWRAPPVQDAGVRGAVAHRAGDCRGDTGRRCRQRHHRRAGGAVMRGALGQRDPALALIRVIGVTGVTGAT
ncbi:protein of unknown function (plasmid) [Cupriavidus taiwanensis]|uniref:Uncharacterized protein n=1 Tax=Cupriavidus taiwanensis TaxID=164546 RepID=A0A9Q7XVV2_9BURK|nr:protein of unknown function [Cupriavidus taiwanensis]